LLHPLGHDHHYPTLALGVAAAGGWDPTIGILHVDRSFPRTLNALPRWMLYTTVINPQVETEGRAELLADHRSVAVGELTGWTGLTNFNRYGPMTFLVWSPESGVVLEIVTTDPDRAVDDLVELALLTRVVEAAE
jgi:hypothetical protein